MSTQLFQSFEFLLRLNIGTHILTDRDFGDGCPPNLDRIDEFSPAGPEG